MKKIIAVLLIAALALSCTLMAGCDGDTNETGGYKDPVAARKLAETDDKYRNYYHIWVCAFADSNGDETGDLQGIIDNLDYINDGNPETDTDLGMTGIWLSPIMPSDSYHKYDVDDYMDIDPEFGDIETFDKLIEECDKRGIDVILDLVLNHCGTGHEFYQNALNEAKGGNLDGYAKYYRFQAAGTSPGVGFRQVVGQMGLWYEGQFSTEMPEWNLAYDGTRAYFEEVAKFWLEKGVAGFRLDAVKYMTDETTDGVEFLDWFYKTAQKYNPDVYMVGENWQSNSYLYDLYESGIDSQFAFAFASSTGHFVTTANSGDGKSLASQLYKFDSKSDEANPNGAINAMFLSNHDQVRSGSYFSKGLNVMKNAAALYLLAPGNSFTYYGEEIGMKTPGNYHGNDAYYRSPMIWDSDVEPDIWCTADAFCDLDFGGVKQQTEDENSLLSFYRRAIKIRNQNPEIARGQITETYEYDDNMYICAYKLETEDSAVIVVHNLNPTKASEMEITDEMLKDAEIVADLYAGADDASAAPAIRGETQPAAEEDVPEYASINDGVLVLPPRASVVLKTAE